MSDLISRDDVLRIVDYYGKWNDCHGREREAIEQLPHIQPDIVRCKDCKYAEYIDDVQTLWCTECGQGRTVAPNDFCSYAERRTDE